MKRIHVAAGIILQGDKVLLAKRPSHVHMGGLWEFPGGKLEANESLTDALARELKEEIGIDVSACEPFMQVSHDYPDKQVLLDFCKVTEFTGEPKGLEQQQVSWVPLIQLSDYAFPEANLPVVKALYQTLCCV